MNDRLDDTEDEAMQSERSPIVWRLLGLLAIILTLPFLLMFGLFPLLQGRPFNSVAELDPAQIARLEVRLYNRTELDEGDDVGPYIAAPQDYERLLQPLREVPTVPEFSGATGPYLGEYRIVLKNGRKGTIYFYWVPTPGESALSVGFGSLAGSAGWSHAASQGDLPAPAARLRFKIGSNKYEGSSTKAIIAAAEAAARNGVKKAR